MTIKNLFSTPKKAVITLTSVVLALIIIGVGASFAVKQIAVSKSIGATAAESYALADAGLSPEDVTSVKSKFERTDGKYCYKVQFESKGSEYSYVIDGENGKIISAEVPDSITVEEAKQIALADAGLTADEVTFSKAELEEDNGGLRYDIEFETSDREYEYEIDANSGVVLEKSSEAKASPVNTPSPEDPSGTDSELIGVERAKEIALADSGCTQGSVTFTKAELDNDDEKPHYEIDFHTDKNNYEYDIDAFSGKILDKEVEKTESKPSPNPSATPAPDAETYIGKAKARSIALKDANVSEKDATFTKTELDRDDGRVVYDVEFYTSDAEYEYEIDAVTGKITDRSVEKNAHNDSGELLGIDEAKRIAIEYAGLKASDVTFVKAKLESEHGRVVYELEFYASGIEYEIEIDAVTGEVLDFDFEKDDD